MKLFLLQLNENLHGYGMYLNHYVIAKNENQARTLACEECKPHDKNYNYWLNSKNSSCEEIKINKDVGLVVTSFYQDS